MTTTSFYVLVYIYYSAIYQTWGQDDWILAKKNEGKIKPSFFLHVTLHGISEIRWTHAHGTQAR